MSCPDALTLMLAEESQSGEAWLHAQGCAACQALLEQDRSIDAGLRRLRDPAPPGDLLGGVLARVAEVDARRRAEQRQLAAGFGIAALLFAVLVAAFGQQAFVEPAIDGIRSLAALTTAATAIGRAAVDALPGYVVPVLALQSTVFMFGCAALMRRALGPARRVSTR